MRVMRIDHPIGECCFLIDQSHAEAARENRASCVWIQFTGSRVIDA